MKKRHETHRDNLRDKNIYKDAMYLKNIKNIYKMNMK